MSFPEQQVRVGVQCFAILNLFDVISTWNMWWRNNAANVWRENETLLPSLQPAGHNPLLLWRLLWWAPSLRVNELLAPLKHSLTNRPPIPPTGAAAGDEGRARELQRDKSKPRPAAIARRKEWTLGLQGQDCYVSIQPWRDPWRT